MTVSKTKAIKMARDKVSIVNQGSQYVVHTWSPRHNSTWVSHSMDYWKARGYARNELLKVALSARGINDPDETAYVLAEREGRWTDLVP